MYDVYFIEQKREYEVSGWLVGSDKSIRDRNTTTSALTASTWKSIAYGDGKFVVVGGGNKVAYSHVPITWCMSNTCILYTYDPATLHPDLELGCPLTSHIKNIYYTFLAFSLLLHTRYSHDTCNYNSST